MRNGVLSSIINRLDSIESRIERIANRIIIENSEVILAMIKDGQLGLGLDSYGKALIHPTKRNNNSKRIGRYEYSTSNYFAKINKPREEKNYKQSYNMDWTGELFESLGIKGNVQKKQFDIFSSTGKLKKLEEIYSTKLGVLSEENNFIVNNEILMPNLYKQVLIDMFR